MTTKPAGLRRICQLINSRGGKEGEEEGGGGRLGGAVMSMCLRWS